MIIVVVQFVLGLIYANTGEWLVHKYILHGLGKNPHSFWAYHWHDHHAVCVKNLMFDHGYQKLILTQWNVQTKELAVLLVIILLHMPLLLFFPVFTCMVYASLMLYYYKHRKAHLDPIWAERHLRWHYDHHLCNNSVGNWCITWPWFDYLMGTRIKFNLKAIK